MWPPGHRVGRHLRYVPAEVLDWVRAQAWASTNAAAPGVPGTTVLTIASGARASSVKTDAERWLAQRRSHMAQGDWIDPARGRVTFGEYAPDWLEGRAGNPPSAGFDLAPSRHADLADGSARPHHLRRIDMLGRQPHR